MSKIGVIICNYNKKEYVSKCMDSLKAQTYKDFDICIVDNASTDGSADYFENNYKDNAHIIINAENLGGSGGFNTGIKWAVSNEYEYFMLLDNDVVLAPDCIEELLKLMESDMSIGVQGCLILKMDYPDMIQEYGPSVNYNKLIFELNYKGEHADCSIPEMVECDYVPACALIARAEVVKNVGVMPEENFIYYDDITWCVECKKAGYKVVANSKAKAWHKGGAASNPTTFGSYYLNRNKLKFFSRYYNSEANTIIDDARINERTNQILEEVFQGYYTCKCNNRINTAKTRIDAFLDALSGVKGRADAYKIRENDKLVPRINQLLHEYDFVIIRPNGYMYNAGVIVSYIDSCIKDNMISTIVYVEDDNHVGDSIAGYLIENRGTNSVNDRTLTLEVCSHIRDMHKPNRCVSWIDGYLNLLHDKIDFDNQDRYEDLYNEFKIIMYDRVRAFVEQNLK